MIGKLLKDATQISFFRVCKCIITYSLPLLLITFLSVECKRGCENIKITQITEDLIEAYCCSSNECGITHAESEGLILRSCTDSTEKSLLISSPHDFKRYFEDDFIGYARTSKGVIVKVFGDTNCLFFIREKRTLCSEKYASSNEDDIRVCCISISRDSIVIDGGCGTFSEVVPFIEVCRKYYKLPIIIKDVYDCEDESNLDFAPIKDTLLNDIDA